MEIPQRTPADALLTIAACAALCDGGKSDAERASLKQLASELGLEDAGGATRDLLLGRASLEEAVASLTSSQEKQLAYEMALAVCEAGGGVSERERAFLEQLAGRLGLSAEVVAQAGREVTDAVVSPLAEVAAQPAPMASGDHGPMILRYAILCGALELLPETLATMAVVPLQVKMVYRIGRAHGVDLDLRRVKEFLAVAGLGVGAQMLEGFARSLFGRLGKTAGGKLGGRLASQAAGSAATFAATFAIGRLADAYYAGGRKLDAATLRSSFETLRGQALELHSRYLPEIRERAGTLTPSSVIQLLRNDSPA